MVAREAEKESVFYENQEAAAQEQESAGAAPQPAWVASAAGMVHLGAQSWDFGVNISRAAPPTPGCDHNLASLRPLPALRPLAHGTDAATESGLTCLLVCRGRAAGIQSWLQTAAASGRSPSSQLPGSPWSPNHPPGYGRRWEYATTPQSRARELARNQCGSPTWARMTQEQRDEATKAVGAQRQLSRSYDPSLQNRVPTSQVPPAGTPARREQIERFMAGSGSAGAAGLAVGAISAIAGIDLVVGGQGANLPTEVDDHDDAELSGISGVSSPGLGQTIGVHAK
eukprot:COSAG02_NODE_13298_length_1413_cov_0.826484_1_plen_283_part_10